MTPISKVLDRIETGDATVADAQSIRHYINMLTVYHCAERQHYGKSLQDDVLRATTKRGYRDGWNDAQFAVRTVAKAIEEIAELAAHFDMPNAFFFGMGDVVQACGDIARDVFDTPESWIDLSQDLDALDVDAVADEVADVIITMLNVAAMFGFDALERVRAKSSADVARGVRVTR